MLSGLPDSRACSVKIARSRATATGSICSAVSASGLVAVARERAIFTEQARESGKPDNIIEKMVEGRLRKFYEEVVLLKQAFVLNPDITVEAALKEAEKEIGAPARITGFVRFALGEGIEREETDFAAEVAAAAKK
jgi:elongation factor Ts